MRVAFTQPLRHPSCHCSLPMRPRTVSHAASLHDRLHAYTGKQLEFVEVPAGQSFQTDPRQSALGEGLRAREKGVPACLFSCPLRRRKETHVHAYTVYAHTCSYMCILYTYMFTDIDVDIDVASGGMTSPTCVLIGAPLCSKITPGMKLVISLGTARFSLCDVPLTSWFQCQLERKQGRVITNGTMLAP